eukprot:7112645-Pyramimonas_sp.AAC.1
MRCWTGSWKPWATHSSRAEWISACCQEPRIHLARASHQAIRTCGWGNAPRNGGRWSFFVRTELSYASRPIADLSGPRSQWFAIWNESASDVARVL